MVVFLGWINFGFFVLFDFCSFYSKFFYLNRFLLLFKSFFFCLNRFFFGLNRSLVLFVLFAVFFILCVIFDLFHLIWFAFLCYDRFVLFMKWEMFEKFLKIYSTSIWSSFNEIFTGSKTLNFCFHLINTLISLTQLYFEHIFYFQLILLKNRWKVQFQILLKKPLKNSIPNKKL